MRQYIVKVDSSTTTCSFFTFLAAFVFRSFKGWSKPRIIGSYVSKSVRD